MAVAAWSTSSLVRDLDRVVRRGGGLTSAPTSWSVALVEATRLGVFERPRACCGAVRAGVREAALRASAALGRSRARCRSPRCCCHASANAASTWNHSSPGKSCGQCSTCAAAGGVAARVTAVAVVVVVTRRLARARSASADSFMRARPPVCAVAFSPGPPPIGSTGSSSAAAAAAARMEEPPTSTIGTDSAALSPEQAAAARRAWRSRIRWSWRCSRRRC